jgi:hypothetical protein
MEDPELHALELELERLLTAAPSPEHERRVARRVAVELHRSRQSEWVLYVAAVAAMLVLAINLSWSVNRATTQIWRTGETAAVSAEQIEQLVPSLSRREALRQALVLRGGRPESATFQGHVH